MRLPGEKAARLVAQAEGVPVPVPLVEALRGHAARLGVNVAVLG
ncbi:MAG TPA: hypothetical protein VIL69_07120 [Roseomonas sp.]